MKGKVKFFNDSKGYGFITDETNGSDVFVHITGLLDRVKKGDLVEYEIKDGKKGPKAINVMKKVVGVS